MREYYIQIEEKQLGNDRWWEVRARRSVLSAIYCMLFWRAVHVDGVEQRLLVLPHDNMDVPEMLLLIVQEVNLAFNGMSLKDYWAAPSGELEFVVEESEIDTADLSK